jgi:hypothetical protein
MSDSEQPIAVFKAPFHKSGRCTYTLYRDRVSMAYRGPGSTGESTVGLSELKPYPARHTRRRYENNNPLVVSVIIIALGFFILGHLHAPTLHYAYVILGSIFLIGIPMTLLKSYKVIWVEYNSDRGSFSVICASNNTTEFDAFIDALNRQVARIREYVPEPK